MADWRRANPHLDHRGVTRALIDALVDRYNSRCQSAAFWDDRERAKAALEKALRSIERWATTLHLPKDRRTGLVGWHTSSRLGRRVQQIRAAIADDAQFSTPRPRRAANRPRAVRPDIRAQLKRAGIAAYEIKPLLQLVGVLPDPRRR
jgi:hypothetical protein